MAILPSNVTVIANHIFPLIQLPSTSIEEAFGPGGSHAARETTRGRVGGGWGGWGGGVHAMLPTVRAK